MGAEFQLEGTERLQRYLREQPVSAPIVMGAALRAEGERIMLESKRLVPVDTGTLRASGVVLGPVRKRGDAEVTLGYGGPAAKYALSVHENPRSGKTGGVTPSGGRRTSWAKVGQWKYLEQPVLAAQKGMAVRLGATVAAMLGRKGLR